MVATTSDRSLDTAGSPNDRRQAPQSKAENRGRELAELRGTTSRHSSPPSCCPRQHERTGVTHDEAGAVPGNEPHVVTRNLAVTRVTSDLLHRLASVVQPMDVTLGQETTIRVDRNPACRTVEHTVREHSGHASLLGEAEISSWTSSEYVKQS